MLKLSILIPAYHEEKTIAEVIRRVAAVDVRTLGFEKQIVICDDGSQDRTAREIARASNGIDGIKVVRHATNRGKGAAIRSSLAHATGDYVLIQDADLEYDVADYPLLLERARMGAEVVYGSRFLARPYPHGMKVSNWFANLLLTATANQLYGHRLTDEATCLKLFRTSLLRDLDLRCERFEFCPEVTAKLGKRGVPIVEVPIRYSARAVGDGKKIGWPDGIAAMWMLVKHRLTPPGRSTNCRGHARAGRNRLVTSNS